MWWGWIFLCLVSRDAASNFIMQFTETPPVRYVLFVHTKSLEISQRWKVILRIKFAHTHPSLSIEDSSGVHLLFLCLRKIYCLQLSVVHFWTFSSRLFTFLTMNIWFYYQAIAWRRSLFAWIRVSTLKDFLIYLLPLMIRNKFFEEFVSLFNLERLETLSDWRIEFQ